MRSSRSARRSILLTLVLGVATAAALVGVAEWPVGRSVALVGVLVAWYVGRTLDARYDILP